MRPSSTISAFWFIADEWPWIAYSVAAIIAHVDQVVVVDQTPELHKNLLGVVAGCPPKLWFEQHCYPRVNVMDTPKYERMINFGLSKCVCDWILWLHADHIPYNPEILRKEIAKVERKNPDALRMSIKVKSFVRDLKHVWSGNGRRDRWPQIVRNGHGLHYFGRYGNPEEDFYFKNLTGKIHNSNWTTNVPYAVHPTEFSVAHFCELKPDAFRLERMKKALKNQGADEKRLDELAKAHPRVSLEARPDMGFDIKPAKAGDLPKAMKGFRYGKP